MKYKLSELTPGNIKCAIGTCPGVYELTSKNIGCGIGACPGVYEGMKDNYLIVGKIENANEFGLEKKVGKDEMLISVPKGLIDNLSK